MARGFIVGTQSRTTSTLLSSSIATATRISFLATNCRATITSPQFQCLPSTRFFCNRSQAHAVEHFTDMTKYREAFSRRMAMAGLKPHHRIALGVSGGPDSTALCILTAGWKTGWCNWNGGSSEFIDGLLAIIVDHGLREDSKKEANIVSHHVSDMGIRCEIVRCDWLDGRPKLGHLQEEARDMRYQLFHKVCIHHHISVLLIAHHADDQAELFILRLSRNSGVLGLAGMAFASQIYSLHTYSADKDIKSHSILLVRPLLDFSKEDMYKICQGNKRDWVEDPTNQSPLFVRNRIRMSLGDLSSCGFKSELQAVISACRRTRSYVEHICSNLIDQTVTVTDQGYVVIDLEILNPSKIEDVCLSKFLALVLQFVSQRQRPIRGSASKLLLDYIRTFPCKTSLTVAGCYLCPAPGSKGTKALVCCSIHCALPSNIKLFLAPSKGECRHSVPNIEQVIADAKLYSSQLVLDASEGLMLGMTSDSVLSEAKGLNILSESTYRNILLLQRKETKQFQLNTEVKSDNHSMRDGECVSMSPSEPLRTGQVCYFMNRFFVTWNLSKEVGCGAFHDEVHYEGGLGELSWNDHCGSCVVGDKMVAELRHMIESDWLYLAKLSKGLNLGNLQWERVLVECKPEQIMKPNLCSDYVRLSAKQALLSLKSVPVAARRSLPVLVSCHGQLLSIPTINFNLCPCLKVSAVFHPKVPLGGGYSSFI